MFVPASVPGVEQTCVAIGIPRAQSLRQQELVCLRTAHADCPRYQRGAMVLASGRSSRGVPTVPRATLAALLILVLSAGISFGFVVQRGGIAMPVVEPDPSSVAVIGTPTAEPTEAPVETTAPASASVEPSASTAPTDAATPTPTEVPTPTPTPAPAVTPAPTAKPTAKPTPKPTPKATKKPRSSRYQLLDPCPDRKNCWIYVVRSGDNMYSIANYFGHSLSTMYQWNPQYPDKRLRVGDQLRMPPPTR